MKKYKKFLIVSATVIAALTIPTVDKVMFAAKDDTLFDDPVFARGKGFEIKQSQLEEVFIAFKANAAAINERVPEDKREELEAELLHELVLTKILVQKATEADRAKANEATKEMVDKVKARASSETIFNLRLKALGLTPQSFEKQVQEQEIRKAVLQREVKSKVEISDAQIKKYYDENPTDFEQPEKVRAAHILVSTTSDGKEPLPAEKKKEKEALAQKIKARVEAGEDFAKLAKEFSNDPGSRDKGGEYTFGRGQMVAPFEKAAFSLRPGQISGIVETSYGYHVIKLLEKIPAKKETLSEASPRIKEFLVAKELVSHLPPYYEQLKKEAEVKILNEKLAALIAAGKMKDRLQGK